MDEAKLRDLTTQIELVVASLKLLDKKVASASRRPRSRALLQVPCLSVWFRGNGKILPYYRHRKPDGSLLEFGILGLVVLLSLPAWKKK